MPAVHAQSQAAVTAAIHAAPKGAQHTTHPVIQGRGVKPNKPTKPTTPPAAAKKAKPNPKAPAGESTKSMTVQEHLATQPQLAAKLGTLLPGMNVSDAAQGFQNLGQFVAAAHVSHNLDIPFLTLKSRMTGPQPISLGQAIQELKPGVKTKNEVRRAEAQARNDMKTDKH